MIRGIILPVLQITFSPNAFFYVLFTSMLAFFAPLQLMFITFFFAIVMDMITGMMASHKLGEKIVSKKMMKTINKFLVYGLVSMVFYCFQMAIIPMVPIINVVFGIIILRELKSMTENCDVIFTTKIWSTIYEKVNYIFRSQKGIGKEHKKFEQDEKGANDKDCKI